MIYTSPFPPVEVAQQHKGGVFDFTLSKANPNFNPSATALIDALSGKKVRTALYKLLLSPGEPAHEPSS